MQPVNHSGLCTSPHHPHCPGCVGLVGSGGLQPRLLLPLPELPALSLPSSPLSRPGLSFPAHPILVLMSSLSCFSLISSQVGGLLMSQTFKISVPFACLTPIHTTFSAALRRWQGNDDPDKGCPFSLGCGVWSLELSKGSCEESFQPCTGHCEESWPVTTATYPTWRWTGNLALRSLSRAE